MHGHEPGGASAVALRRHLSVISGRAGDLISPVLAALHQYGKATALYELLEPEGLIIAGLPEATDRLGEIKQRVSDLVRSDRRP